MGFSIRTTGLVLCLGLTAPVMAQDESSACLGLLDGMRLVIATAPEVAAAQAMVAEAEASEREARSLWHPQISTFGRTAAGDSGLTSSQIENQVGVQLSQRLYDFGDGRLARESAEHLRDQRAYELEAQQGDMAYVLAGAYLSHLEALAMIEVISERRDYFARQRDAVVSLLASGGATRADRAQIEAQLASAEADALELRFTAERHATRVRELTGLDMASLCNGTEAAAALSDALSGLDTLDGLIAAALADNPQIGARQGAVRSLEAGLERARRNRLPVIEAGGIASYVHDDQRNDWEGRDRLGIDVSVPLYTGQALGARRERAAAQLAFEQSALRELQRNLREQAEIAFRRAISLEAQLVRREAVARSQGEYFDAIAGEFRFGLGTLPDLVDARLDHERAQVQVISARFELMRQRLELMRLTGRMPVEEPPQ